MNLRTVNKEIFLSYLWLFIGAILFIFSNGRWVVPIASWIAPVFIVYFYRSKKTKDSIILPLILITCSILISFKGVTHIKGYFEYIVLIGMSIAFFIPYFLDWLFYKKVKGFKATLILPLTGVIFEYLFSMVSPYGSWGSLAYTQYGNLPMMQIASITGLSGISFLLYWFYSCLSWVWENEFNIIKVKNGIAIFFSLLSIVLLLGGIRYIIPGSNPKTVKIASISVPHKYVYTDLDAIQSNVNCMSNTLKKAKNTLSSLQENLINLTDREAKAGSKIILWHELNGVVLKEDEPLFISKVSKIARENEVYILMAMDTITPGHKKSENKTIFIKPDGTIAYTYMKFKPTLDDKETTVKGDGIIKAIDTPYGKIGSAICYDFDFPSFIRQAGKNNVDIMLVPSSDWKEIDPIHSKMAVFRAVENGFAFVRQTQLGLSLSADCYGNILSSMDYFTAQDRVMISQVPIKGIKTIYSIFGDWFPWVCMLCLLYWVILRMVFPELKNFFKKPSHDESPGPQ